MRRRYKHNENCCIDGCEEERAYADGLCRKHHTRLVRTGTTELIKHPRPINSRKAKTGPIQQNIEALRLQRNWSVLDLCRNSGVSQTVLYSTCDPLLETLRALGAAFNVEYWRLLIPGEFIQVESSQGLEEKESS